jgi:hypothetical protein
MKPTAQAVGYRQEKISPEGTKETTFTQERTPDLTTLNRTLLPSRDQPTAITASNAAT